MENEILNLSNLVFGEQRSRELQLLIYLGVSREIDGETALVVGDGVVDVLVLEEQSDDLAPALRRRDVERGVSILVPRIYIERGGTI